MSFKHAGSLIMALAGMISPCSGEEEASIIEGTKGGLTVRVSCPKSFPNNRVVEISFVVLNRSDSKYGLMVPSDLQDTRVRLTGPDGKEIAGYQEKDGWLYGFNFKRRFLAELESGEDFEGDSVSLSNFWSLSQVGEYRCRFTKKIYRGDSASGKRLNINNPGTAVEVEVPEFTFRIESIDPAFKSPWAPKPVSEKAFPVEEDESMSPGRSAVYIAFVLALLGIILRRIGRKRKSP